MINPLERLWKDRMEIYRWVDVVANGVTKSEEKLIDDDVKCQYSKGQLTDTGDGGVPTLTNTYTLFCSLETDLKEGDQLIVTQRSGKQISLSVGEGFPYSNHQEFSVKRSGTA